MGSNSRLILASASPRRKELLARLGLPFSVQVADIDESRLAGESPTQMTLRLAEVKAKTIYAQQTEPAWVLGADTTVALEQLIFSKPNSRDEAIETLTLLANKTHQAITSVCLLGDRFERSESVVSQVRFGPLSEAVIHAYCDSNEPYDKAGGYGIQGSAGAFVQHIKGDYSAIVGLPLWTTTKLLRAAGLITQ